MPRENPHKAEDDTYKNHQYAFDSNGNWVNAKKTEYRKYSEFYCECPDRHAMRLSKPSGIPGKRPFCDYFAHNAPNSKRNKSMGQADQAETSSCRSGGESSKHYLAKHILRELVGSYYFTISRCQGCHAEEIMDSVGGLVYMESVSEDKRWRYDCLLKKNGKAVVAMEVVHSHISGSVKIDSVRASGLEIVEFRVDDVISMRDRTNGRTKLDVIKVRNAMCHNCSVMTSYKEEISELFNLEKLIRNEYERQEEMKQYLKEETLKRQRQEKTDLDDRLKQEEIQNRQKQDEETRNSLKQEKLISQTSHSNKPRPTKSQPQDVYNPPHFIYRSVYHPPDGTPSWTPYEMIAEQI